MSNVRISQLPAAPVSLTGTELVPVVQNGQTVQTTVSAIQSSPTLTQTFLTTTNQPSLANSRYLATGTGLNLTDGGAQSTMTIALTGAPASLVTAGNGLLAKTNSTTLAARTISVSGGLSVTNADGVGGNPAIATTGLLNALAATSGTGLLATAGGTTLTPVTITGVANQIAVTAGNTLPVIGLADNAVMPGTGSMTIPSGTTGQQPVSSVGGMIRFDTTQNAFYGYSNGSWNLFSLTGSTFSAGSTGFTPNTPSTGAVTLAGILNVANGGTGLSTTPANGALDIGNGTGFTRATLTAGSNITITNSAGGISIASSNPGGTVTSVSFTGGIISVATATTTPALTVAGTSGGIPYFSSGTTWATSAALAASALMVGGGVGAAPSTITTGTGVVTALGVNTGSAGAFVVNGGALGTPSSGTLTNATGLPISTGVSGLGTGVAAALGIAIGSAGAPVTFDGALGTPSSGTVTNLTGTASININGTVGATTPTTGNFTTVTATTGIFGGTF